MEGKSRLFLFLAILFFITTIVFIVVFALAYNGTLSSSSSTTSVPEYCTEPNCVRTSAYYTAKINVNADPCQDFFEYACGQWIAENPIPEESTNYQTYTVLRNRVKTNLKGLLELEISDQDGEAIEKAKMLYSSCIDTDKIESLGNDPLLSFLAGNLTWPVISDAWTEGDYDEIGTIATLAGDYNNHILVNYYVSTDDKNSSVYVLKLTQSSLVMTDAYYLNDTRYAENQQALLSLMIDIAEMLGQENETLRTEDMTAAFNFEKEVAKIKIPSSQQTSESIYNKWTMGQLQTEVPGFDWLQLLNDIIHTQEITSDETIIVRVPEYLRSLVDLLDKTPPRVKQNYLVWRIVKNRINNLGQEYQDRVLAFNKVITGQNALNARWKTCVDYTDSVMPGPTGNLFVENYFEEEKKASVEDMVVRIKKSFKNLLDTQVEWMDDESKVYAKEKCDYVDPKIGYAEFYKNKTQLAEDLKDVSVSDSDYFGNVVGILGVSAQGDWPYIGKLVIRDFWSTPPTTVNAYYSPSLNRITFPAGELQYPFFWGEDYPFSFQYGAIGTIIGHELTHAFDDNGRQYDKVGNKLQWWTNASIEAFEKETQCLVDQYNNYYWDTAGDYLDGQNTLGENIADNGGIRESFYAYQEWIKEKGKDKPLPGTDLTHDQFFFIGYANVRCGHYRPEAAADAIKTDVHSPGKFRVIGSMSNFEEFAKTWNCPEGTPMNRGKDRCVIW